MSNTLRYLLIAGIVGYLAVSNGVPAKLGIDLDQPTAVVYSGSLSELHRASRVMRPEHRAQLSAAFAAGADTYAADDGTVEMMAQWQRYAEAVVQFGYRGMGRVDARYPEVAKAIVAELSRASGTEDVAIAGRKQGLVAVLREISAAVR